MIIDNNSDWKIACFDLDGTLVRGTSTGLHLAKKIGHANSMAEIEARYQKGEVSNAEVAALDGIHYKGYSISDIHQYLEDIPTVDHIAETVEFLSSKGIKSLLCTLAWDFVAEFFAKQYGFIRWSGPALVTDKNGVFTGEVLSDFHETDKPIFVNDYCLVEKTDMSKAFHVGDSRSDVPLFKAVGFSVAFNGDDLANSSASVSIESNSLRDVLQIIPGLKT
jgi:phosphoserine phosphatase